MGSQSSRFSLSKGRKYHGNNSSSNREVHEASRTGASATTDDNLILDSKQQQPLLHSSAILDMNIHHNDGIVYLYTCSDDNKIARSQLHGLIPRHHHPIQSSSITSIDNTIYYKSHTRAVNRIHIKSQVLYSVSRDLSLRMVRFS